MLAVNAGSSSDRVAIERSVLAILAPERPTLEEREITALNVPRG